MAALPAQAGQIVPFRSDYQRGAIVIVTQRRELDYVLGLDRGNYAIHGNNNPSSVGSVSHGCIRMYNADFIDLYRRVRLGTDVYVLL